MSFDTHRFLYLIIAFLLFCSVSYARAVDYANPNVPKEVNKLREFRDFHLKKYEAGRRFIDYYYTYGPVAAAAIKKRERLRSLVRLSLLPLMYAGRNFDATLWIIKIFAGLLALTFLWSIGRLSKKKGDRRALHTFLHSK